MSARPLGVSPRSASVSRSSSPRAYKGFDVGIVPRNVVRFGYEIQSREGSPIRSPGTYGTASAAFAAACAFVDEVDRRVGLGPLEHGAGDSSPGSPEV